MAERNYKRHIVVYKNYFIDFKKTLSQQTLKKIYQIFLYIMTLESFQEDFVAADIKEDIPNLLVYHDFRVNTRHLFKVN